MNIERLSLDQLRVFMLVADLGSFSAAARKLVRAQSAVSHAVAGLEAQLGLELFDRSAYRPRLTAHARTLLPEVRTILERIDRLEGKAQMLSGGVEPQVGLVVDGAFPLSQIADALHRFKLDRPGVVLRIFNDSMSDLVERLATGNADIGIVATLPEVPVGFDAFALMPVRLIPVASPSYHLSRHARLVPQEALVDAMQIVLTDKGAASVTTRDYGVLSTRTWRVTDLATKRDLLLAGLGWGGMPQHLIERELREGSLVRLPTADFPSYGDMLPSFCLHDPSRRLGPAASSLLQALRKIAERHVTVEPNEDPCGAPSRPQVPA